MLVTSKIFTPAGGMLAAATEKGLCLLEFIIPDRTERNLAEISTLICEDIGYGENDILIKLKDELSEYFEGERRNFSIPLEIFGSPFRRNVWNELLNIPFGSTITYREQAAIMKKPLSIRAVANANSSNRLCIVIPCHRVIGSNGQLTGYSGGLERKRWLLDHEKKYSGKPLEISLF